MSYSLDELERAAEGGDVSFYVLIHVLSPDQKTRERAKNICQKGRRVAALESLRSASDEGMRSGTTTRDQRLERARIFAKLAELDIEVLAKEHSLEHLLK